MLLIAPLLALTSASAQTGTPEQQEEVLAMVETVPVTYNATIAGKEIVVEKVGDNLLPGSGEFVDTRVVGDQNCHLVVIAMKSDPTIYRYVDQYAHEAALAAAEKAKLADQPIFGPALPPVDISMFVLPADPLPPAYDNPLVPVPDLPAFAIRDYDPDHIAAFVPD